MALPSTSASASRARRSAEEASRGALIAAHAAAILVKPVSLEALCLVRIAEGLLRAAVAQLRIVPAGHSLEPATLAPASGPVAARPIRRRRGRARGRPPQIKEELQSAAASRGGPAAAGNGDYEEIAVRPGSVDEYMEGGELLDITKVASVPAEAALSGAGAGRAAGAVGALSASSSSAMAPPPADDVHMVVHAPEQKLQAAKAHLEAQPVALLRSLAGAAGLPTHGAQKAVISRLLGKIQQSLHQ